MQYRHLFHAGNFADVHKHIALLQLVGALARKAKGFLLLDTHAGEGLYDLASPEARHSAESAAGIAQLEQGVRQGAQPPHPAIGHYLDLIAQMRRAAGGRPHLYPGSPVLAARVLRPVDQLVAVESQAAIARALQRALDSVRDTAGCSSRVVSSDGYQQLRALLPPPTRRGLVLIDPPYEREDEEHAIAQALAAGLERFETGVFALWYPIKRRHDTDLWLARILRGVQRPHVTIELCVRPPDNAAGLNGSGMLVVNPPWQFDEDAAQWQAQLHTLLDASGGSEVRWLQREAPGGR